MATIHDLLHRSISDMSDSEIEARLIEIRKSIRIKPTKKVSSAKQSKPKEPNVMSLFSGMSPEDRATLIAELEGL